MAPCEVSPILAATAPDASGPDRAASAGRLCREGEADLVMWLEAAAAGAASPSLGRVPGSVPEPAALADPPAISPAQALAHVNAALGHALTLLQARAAPVGALALVLGGFLLLCGWLFGLRAAGQAGRWLLGGVLLGYLLIMGAPRLMAALGGLVLR